MNIDTHTYSWYRYINMGSTHMDIVGKCLNTGCILQPTRISSGYIGYIYLIRQGI